MRVAKRAVALVMVSTAAMAQGTADMVRRDGDVLGAPEFSPSGKRFVSVNNKELGSHSYDVAIWVMTPDEPKLEFRYETPQGDRYELWEFRGWDGEDRIKLGVNVGGAMLPFESEAVRTRAGWQIKRPPQSN
jgi:hypothetical protein